MKAVTEQKTLFKRHFSAIRGIQKEKTVTYELLAEGPDGYGVRVESECEGCRRSDAQAGLPPSLEEARGLVTYLYENAVTLESWRDLTADLLKSLHHLV